MLHGQRQHTSLVAAPVEAALMQGRSSSAEAMRSCVRASSARVVAEVGR
jgi:hypothetical protein